MFKKILIANRGEIACRVIRTARRMGIASVAVYSEADAEALHAREADEAVGIGPAPSSESYLRIDRIVEACRQTGAEAVHPGYGFLSERADFAVALAKAGIAFIGPTPEAISAMGDKIAAKRLAHAAGVATVPGNLDTVADAEHAVLVDDELDGAGRAVADRACQRDRLGAHRGARPGVEQWARRLLDDFLVAALDRAFALAQMHDIAVRVAEHLDLDVTRLFDVFFEKDPVVAKAR